MGRNGNFFLQSLHSFLSFLLHDKQARWLLAMWSTQRIFQMLPHSLSSKEGPRAQCHGWNPRPPMPLTPSGIAQALLTSRLDPAAEEPRLKPPFLLMPDRTCSLRRGFLSPNLFSCRGKHNLSSPGLGEHANQPNSAPFCALSPHANPPEINQARGAKEGEGGGSRGGARCQMGCEG